MPIKVDLSGIFAEVKKDSESNDKRMLMDDKKSKDANSKFNLSIDNSGKNFTADISCGGASLAFMLLRAAEASPELVEAYAIAFATIADPESMVPKGTSIPEGMRECQEVAAKTMQMLADAKKNNL